MEKKENNNQKKSTDIVPEKLPVQSSEENNWAMFCHLSALAMFAVPLGSILGPLVIWLIKKEEMPVVDRHGKAALNFHISMALYIIISAFLILCLVGILFIIILAVFQLIMIIVASIKANNGEDVNYPLSIQFFK